MCRPQKKQKQKWSCPELQIKDTPPPQPLSEREALMQGKHDWRDQNNRTRRTKGVAILCVCRGFYQGADGVEDWIICPLPGRMKMLANACVLTVAEIKQPEKQQRRDELIGTARL